MTTLPESNPNPTASAKPPPQFERVWRLAGIGLVFGNRPNRHTDLPKPIQAYLKKATKAGNLSDPDECELADHFRAGLAHGKSSDDLIAAMGKPKALGNAIYRAKHPIEWRVGVTLKWLGYAALTPFALYILLWAGLRWAKPQPTVDYYALLNQPVLATSPQDQAWPLYRAVISDPRMRRDKLLDALMRPYNNQDPYDKDDLARPGDPDWPKAAAYLQTIQPLLIQFRAAAHKPALGIPLYRHADISDDDLVILHATRWTPSQPVANHPICRLASEAFEPDTSHLSTIRVTCRVLSADMHLAAQQGDVKRFFADFEAHLAAARQLGQVPLHDTGRMFPAELTERPIAHAAQIALAHPGFLTEAQVTDLRRKSAQAIDALASLPTLPDAPYHDRMQRILTPGPNGRITRDGLIYIFRTAGLPDDDLLTAPPSWEQTIGAEILLPLAYLALPSRQGIDAQRAHINNSRRLNAFAPWSLYQTIHPWTHIPADQDLNATPTRLFMELGVFAAAISFENEGRILSHAKAQARTHDTLLALAQYRARHGQYPATLADLVPAFLTLPPRGLEPTETLIYQLTPTGPIIYSKDDGSSPRPDPKTGTVYFPSGRRIDAVLKSPATSQPQTSDTSPPDSPATSNPQTSP
jgi:hypothetical protein